MALTVEFSVGGYRLALPVPMIVQVTRAVAVTPIPDVPVIVLGIVDFHGEIVPVMDIRMRLGLEPRPLRLSDQFVIANGRRRSVAFAVDRVVGLRECDEAELVPARTVVPEAAFLKGVVRAREGLILICDADAFLQADDTRQLDLALADHE